MKNKPLNTWNTEGMYSEWRDKCPLGGAGRYLWKKLKEFPSYDWRESHPPKTADHIYYEEGWELVNRLQDILFCCSSSCGNSWPHPVNGEHSELLLFNFKCEREGCEKWAECVLNKVRSGKTDKHGDDEFVWLPDAPQFHCFAHHYEACYGKKYIPPSVEESRRSAALSRAMERMHKEKPPQSLELDHGLKVDSFTLMDGSYLERLAEIAEEEYQKICNEKVQ